MAWKDVQMSYRSSLPPVLKDMNFDIRGGEKIGVVGRTGAGKSSLIFALLRINELTRGTITIDGVDVSELGLHDLRSSLSVIPQEPVLFSGTIRTNLDPFFSYEDSQLWDALRRACLVEPTFDAEKQPHGFISRSRLTLESTIEPEGANLSVGERSLLSLARALLRDSQIVVLDEATASVDLDTDLRIQKTLQTQFAGKTLICIAHRLRSVIGYNRILVMEGGRIAEFDDPLSLFDNENGTFRKICDESRISRDDIHRARSCPGYGAS